MHRIQSRGSRRDVTSVLVTAAVSGPSGSDRKILQYNLYIVHGCVSSPPSQRSESLNILSKFLSCSDLPIMDSIVLK